MCELGDDGDGRAAEMSDTPKAPSPPTDEEIRALAEEWGISFEVARSLAGQVALDGTETADGEIVTA
jgi:hypothetical protein